MNKRQIKKRLKSLDQDTLEEMEVFQRKMIQFKVEYLLGKEQDPWEARSMRHDLAVYTMLDTLHRKNKIERKQARARAWRHRRERNYQS